MAVQPDLSSQTQSEPGASDLLLLPRLHPEPHTHGANWHLTHRARRLFGSNKQLHNAAIISGSAVMERRSARCCHRLLCAARFNRIKWKVESDEFIF